MKCSPSFNNPIICLISLCAMVWELSYSIQPTNNTYISFTFTLKPRHILKFFAQNYGNWIIPIITISFNHITWSSAKTKQTNTHTTYTTYPEHLPILLIVGFEYVANMKLKIRNVCVYGCGKLEIIPLCITISHNQ